MFTMSVIHNILCDIGFTFTLELIQDFLMIISKRHTSKLTLQALANYCKKFCSGISVLCHVSILCHNRNHSLVQVNVYRTYTIILDLQSSHMPR